MNAFNLDHFARTLLVEMMMFDDEYGVVGNLSLIDTTHQRERFIAAYNFEDDTYLIEEATEWEEYDADEDEDEIGYALAINGKQHACYESPEEAADTLLGLAREHNLTPSFLLLFDDEG